MKQGPSNSSRGDTKVEPRSHGVNVGAVSGIGLQQVQSNPPAMYSGRGYEAPKAATTIHKSGSQRG